MSAKRQAEIARSFGAASDYAAQARMQRIAANMLAQRVAALGLDAPHLLEIGCGTGFLTSAMRMRGMGGEWLVTDLSPAMVDRCRETMGDDPALQFASFDAASGDAPPGGPFDIVTASLAVQWLGPLEPVVERMLGWLKPGGHLIFNTLGSRTFAAWNAALAQAGAKPGTLPLEHAAHIAAIRPDLKAAATHIEVLQEDHADARAFLSALRGIGATVPAPGHRPVSAAALRGAMRQLDADAREDGVVRIGYELVTCHYTRPL